MATGRGGGFGAGFDVYFTGSRFLAGARDSQMPGWKSGKLQPGVPHLRGGFGATAALFGGIACDERSVRGRRAQYSSFRSVQRRLRAWHRGPEDEVEQPRGKAGVVKKRNTRTLGRSSSFYEKNTVRYT